MLLKMVEQLSNLIEEINDLNLEEENEVVQVNLIERCNKCKKEKNLQENFKLKPNGEYTKCCIICLNLASVSREKYRCVHDKQKNHCKICGGSSICEHKKQRNMCKKCNGSYICIHNRFRNQCKECMGISICQHGLQRYHCKSCEGGAFCQHDKRRRECKICSPLGHLRNIVRLRVHQILGPGHNSMSYLGCSIEEYYDYLTEKLKDTEFTWDDYCEKWQIDHILPLNPKNPISKEELIKRFHYSNTQPLSIIENLRKANKE